MKNKASLIILIAVMTVSAFPCESEAVKEEPNGYLGPLFLYDTKTEMKGLGVGLSLFFEKFVFDFGANAWDKGQADGEWESSYEGGNLYIGIGYILTRFPCISLDALMTSNGPAMRLQSSIVPNDKDDLPFGVFASIETSPNTLRAERFSIGMSFSLDRELDK